MNISGKTRVCGVIGDPIEHTLSPIIHNAAFNSLNLDIVFLAFKVNFQEVGSALAGMRALNFVGLNVTMPHKKAVISYLDGIDPDAKFLDSINTINKKDSKLIGFNTDGIGALKALRENGVNPQEKRVLLLGAGGAATAIAYTLAKESNELVILNRTPAQAEKLANILKITGNKKVIAGSLSPNTIQQSLKNSDILVNATSVGMEPNTHQSLVLPEWLKPDLVVMDIIYKPIETKLAKYAKAAGAKVVSGVEMLIYQGATSFEIWTGCKAPIAVMKKAAFNYLQRCNNDW
jgi:shikimate dehydrogenase